MTTPLSSQSLNDVTFPTAGVSSGYAIAEVDPFLDQVAQALRFYEDGSAEGAEPPLTGRDIATARFSLKSFRNGYRVDPVDDILELAQKTLEYYEARV